MEALSFSRIAELEAKLDVLQVRFDKLRTVVSGESDRLERWSVEDRARRETQIDDCDILDARESLKDALSI